MADQRDPNMKYGVNFYPPPLDKANEDVVRRIFGKHTIVLTWRDDGTTDVYTFALGMLFLVENFIKAWKIAEQGKEGTESSSAEQ